MEELNNLQYEITNLDKDSLYYVQVCARNMKGYGAYSATNPSCAQPSSKYNKFNFSQRNVTSLVISLHLFKMFSFQFICEYGFTHSLLSLVTIGIKQ